MRDLLNILEGFEVPIDESVGLANRKPGERFTGPGGEEYTFQSLDFFPEAGGVFPTHEEMAQVIQNLGVDVEWTNKLTTATRAFAVSRFQADDGSERVFGKFFQAINPNRAKNAWHEPGGLKYQSKAAAKESSGYKPSDILTNYEGNTPESILRQIVEKFGSESDEARVTAAFMKAKSFPFAVPRGNIQTNAFRDYFCEMLQPIALVRGMAIEGNASEASDIFFGKGQGYTGCTINFNDNPTGGLYDSLIVSPRGKQIKLSSKGGAGAKASVSNLATCIDELELAPKGRAMLEKYGDVVNIVRIIREGGHFGGPLELAVNYNIIEHDDALFVMTLQQIGPQDRIDWGNHKKLEALYNQRRAADASRIIPAEHMIAAIAYRVADYVNDNTDFSKAATDILNHSALVQMYSTVSEKGDQLIINNFRAVYPGEAIKGVWLDASKSYMSTQGKGNFTFNIDKGDVSSKPAKQSKTDAEAEKKISKFGKQHSVGKDVVQRPGKSKSADLGRERR